MLKISRTQDINLANVNWSETYRWRRRAPKCVRQGHVSAPSRIRLRGCVLAKSVAGVCSYLCPRIMYKSHATRSRLLGVVEQKKLGIQVWISTQKNQDAE